MRLEPDWFRLITGQLWQVTLLIPIAIFLLRGLCRTRSHLAYGVLLVVLLKCVTPPIFTSDVGVFPWAEHHASRIAPRVHSATLVESVAEPATETVPSAATGANNPVQTGTDAVSDEPMEVAASEDATAGSKLDNAVVSAPPVTAVQSSQPGFVGRLLRSPGSLLVSLWCLGMIVFAGWVLFSWRQIRRLCGAPAAPAAVQQLADRLAADLGLRRAPQLRVSDELVMPFAFGVRRPTVLIPGAVLAADQRDNLVLVLAHELNHLRRRDTAVGALQLLIQGIWWFHPLVWWLNREIRRYREHCCDEEVLARLQCRPQNYARCLINVLELNERGSAHFGLAGMSPFEVTSQRLRNIMRPNSPFRRRMPIGSWIAMAGIAVIVLPGARGLPSANAVASVEEGVRSHVTETAPPPPGTIKEPASRKSAPVEQAPRYEWQAGASYPYKLTIEVDHGREVETLSATPTLTVRNSDGGRAEFFIAGETLSSVRTTKPGREPEFDPLRFPEIPRFPRMAYPTGGWRGPYSAPSLPQEHLIRVDDRGRTLSEQGENDPLPYLLGSLGDLLIAQWPAGADAEWRETTGTEVSITHDEEEDPFPIPTTIPASEPQRESLAAEQTSLCALAANADGGWELRRHRDLASVQQIDGEPRIALSEDATWQFRSRGEMPSRLDATAKLVVREDNVTTTFPIRISAERLPAP